MKLFSDRRTRCSTCHRIGKEGGNVGPELSKIGGKFDRPHLIESLLEPSAQIVEGFRTSLLITDKGRTFTGIMKQKTDDSIVLLDANNQPIQSEGCQFGQYISFRVYYPTIFNDSDASGDRHAFLAQPNVCSVDYCTDPGK